MNFPQDDDLYQGVQWNEPFQHPALAEADDRWTREHAETLGRRYASEVARRVDRKQEYGAL